MKDLVLPYRPESTRVVAMNTFNAIKGPAVNPRNKANPVEPVQSLGIGCDPEKAIRGLRN
jgi:hypothetical protein